MFLEQWEKRGEGKGLCRSLGLKAAMQGEFGLENMGTRGGRLLVCLVPFFLRCGVCVTQICHLSLGLYSFRRFWPVRGLGVLGQGGFH
jgi:hypothetical protein